ncbi:hypothetical protein CAPTEDRAFT_214235 [Capitella teleta]|uniref:Uncharacterized protein n=1 Tax=Capitella teleta TaxID=283909 RepID=R7UDM4_CAPTE|nr:hypothetical protein CAPTEDRAFT_214235 [Capitella teleta]|eukprot:ELU01362.1 hypothetical protein CAPTEDRAFT_214235 [Capitella teleta]
MKIFLAFTIALIGVFADFAMGLELGNRIFYTVKETYVNMTQYQRNFFMVMKATSPLEIQEQCGILVADRNAHLCEISMKYSKDTASAGARVYYAITMYRTGKDPALICLAIEEDLRNAAKWANIWGMRFNASKTVAMYIS